MKKSLIALAVAGVVAAPVAMADDVKIYGNVDMNFGSFSNGSNSALAVGSSTSLIGFKGSEDLGNNMSAIWAIEQQVDVDNSAASAGATASAPTGASSGHATFASRNSFGGLKGDFGTVLMGNYDSPYKSATRGLDVFGNQTADNRSIMGQAGAVDARLANALAYVSPSMGGFTVAAAYVTGSEVPAPTGTTGAKTGSAYALAGMYSAGPLYAAVAYQNITYGSSANGTSSTTGYGGSLNAGSGFGAGDTYTAMKAGVGYKVMDNLKVNAVYESINSSGTTVGSAKKQTNIYVGGIFNVTETDAVKLGYTLGGKRGSVANTGATEIAVGYDHNLSKTTKVYAQYASIANQSAATYTISSAGNTSGGFGVAPGKTASAMVVGIQHSF